VARALHDRSPWRLAADVSFLNHGSFGACPEPVLEAQRAWRDRMERQPVQFLARELEGELDAAREEVALFLNADPDGLAFVANATTGVSTVLASLRFEPGDELLACDHEYNATLNALAAAAARHGATVRLAHVPFPVADAGEVVQAYLDAVTPRTRLALVSHVTSPTALVFPVVAIVRELERRGIPTLVDGAHAPGMVPCDLRALNAAYWTGNGHKWLCGPKGSGLLYARADVRASLRPLTVSHGANAARDDRSRFRLEFDWTGTGDPTPWLTLPAAIRFVGGLHEDGWAGLMASNRAMALDARDRLCGAIGIPAPAPDAMLGAMASVPLPGIAATDAATSELQEALLEEDSIEVPVLAFPVAAARRADGTGAGGGDATAAQAVIRVSAQRYNRNSEYAWLAERIAARVKAARSPRSLLGRLRRG
jgi:isopenicillin-N epimerase